MPELVHENDNYYIVQKNDGSGYDAVNYKTGVIEAEHRELPAIITWAEHSNAFLEHKLWKWIAVQGQKNKDELDKEDAVNALVPV